MRIARAGWLPHFLLTSSVAIFASVLSAAEFASGMNTLLDRMPRIGAPAIPAP